MPTAAAIALDVGDYLEARRFEGIVRPYARADVERLRGSMPIEYTLARQGARRLWQLLHTEPFVSALGALTGNQAVQQVRAGLQAIYLSGWQVAADANTAGQMYPDQSLYPANKGYTSVSAELDSIASKSGLVIESSGFHEAEIKGRDLQQVEIDAIVAGSYSQVVHFLNGLQRSQNVYAVESLEAKADAVQGANGKVRVSMHIKTYFRNT